MSTAGSISIVVPTYQRRARVLALLDALGRQTFPASGFEVVVSVDGSTDGTLEALRSLATSFPLRTLWSSRRGRAGALNAGIEVSSGELTLLLDDDMEPMPEMLATHWRTHQARPRIGVMGAVPIDIDAAAPPDVRYIAAKFNGHLMNLAHPGRPLGLTDFYSGHFSIPREVLVEIGGFDDEFRAYGNEDLELSFRLSRAGVSLVYEPGAVARQHNDKRFPALAEDSAAEGRTAVLFALKHPEAFPHLKLGTYAQGPLLLRLIRDWLLQFSPREARPPGWLLRLERLISRLDPPGTTIFYRLALGYVYWLGARDAIRAARGAGRPIEPLVQLAKDLRT